jgi:hypothetical protein
MRINTIFEGSSEIMRLFIAREAVDMHLSIAGDLIDPKASPGKKLTTLFRAGMHYAWWYPTRFLGWGFWPRYASFGPLARHLRFVERTSRRLARSTFHAMVRFGPALEKRQAVLGRIVDIGADLFVMTASIVRANMLTDRGSDETGATALSDLYCRHARRRITARFRALFDNDDAATYRIARRFLGAEFEWLERGIVSLESYRRQVEAAVTADTASEPAAPEPVPTG